MSVERRGPNWMVMVVVGGCAGESEGDHGWLVRVKKIMVS